MINTSNMPARIWLINGHVYSPTVTEKDVPGIAYIRADIVERLAEALWWYASDEAWTVEQVEGSYGDYGTRARTALNSYREASNDKA